MQNVSAGVAEPPCFVRAATEGNARRRHRFPRDGLGEDTGNEHGARRIHIAESEDGLPLTCARKCKAVPRPPPSRQSRHLRQQSPLRRIGPGGQRLRRGGERVSLNFDPFHDQENSDGPTPGGRCALTPPGHFVIQIVWPSAPRFSGGLSRSGLSVSENNFSDDRMIAEAYA